MTNNNFNTRDMKVKLTEKHKELVKKMREGAIVNFGMMTGCYYIKECGKEEREVYCVPVLVNAKLVECKGCNLYTLTDLGRTLDLTV